MKTYKLRAECLKDTNELMLAITRNNFNLESFTVYPVRYQGIYLPDVVLAFKTDAGIEELNKLLEAIPDSHVMIETLELEENYTGERK